MTEGHGKRLRQIGDNVHRIDIVFQEITDAVVFDIVEPNDKGYC